MGSGGVRSQIKEGFVGQGGISESTQHGTGKPRKISSEGKI